MERYAIGLKSQTRLSTRLVEGKEEYELRDFYLAPQSQKRAIEYRQGVMRDLETNDISRVVGTFARGMRSVRENLAQADKLYYVLQKHAWFLHAVDMYCAAVRELCDGLQQASIRSSGLRAFLEHLEDYVASEAFEQLAGDVRQINAELAGVHYGVIIQGNRVSVRAYDGEPDYSSEVQDTFEKFKQGEVEDYRVEYRTSRDMDHVEAQILDLVAKINPEVFSDLSRFVDQNRAFAAPLITEFDRQIQFYVSFRDYKQRIKGAGLSFCYPQIVEEAGHIYANGAFDLALARKLVGEELPVVTNDIQLDGPERILVVTGPNQGGKTTFARMFGQVHYLACLGFPVPGTGAQLMLFDRVFTHFEKVEEVQDLQGKLQDDLVRVRDLLEKATCRSVMVLNEAFTSTTSDDALLLSRKIMGKVSALDCLCVWVTFFDPLATFDEKTVSMVSQVDPQDPAKRTYKIVRKPADGMAYAMAIARKHRLTSQDLRERLNP